MQIKAGLLCDFFGGVLVLSRLSEEFLDLMARLWLLHQTRAANPALFGFNVEVQRVN
ncbi:MAG: hypothetical protein KKC99_03285 [Proteobacteria bacterium]|nr:hypothetical protein [Pseudomonadota bacterium]